MCRDYPNHDKPELVRNKMIFIARVYSVARNMGGKWDEMANAVVCIHEELDHALNALDGSRFPDSVDAVISVHAMLDKGVCNVLKKNDTETPLRHSFSSKYLHFHRPDAFPILDSFAKLGLASKTPHFRTKLRKPTPYAAFCKRMASLCVTKKSLNGAYVASTQNW